MISAFEKFRTRQSYSQKVAAKISASNQTKKDERFWDLTRDPETGKGEALIRFLPPKSDDPEAMPYVKYYSHFFKGDDGRWVVAEACPRTFDKPCPICERNTKLYTSGNLDRYRRSKSRTNYIFNILVINDTAVPENNGKVFLFKTGSTIFTMITDAMQSEYDEPAMPFDVMEGNNFILRSRKDSARGGMISYDKSKFETKLTPIAKNDKELENVFNSMYDLDEVVKELAARVDVKQLEQKCKSAFIENDPGTTSFGETISTTRETMKVENMDKMPWDDVPDNSDNNQTQSSGSEDDDDDLDFFRKLAQ